MNKMVTNLRDFSQRISDAWLACLSKRGGL